MYQAILTRRYLTSKVMPMLAALAVALCVAMVLVVWSVMGGFLSTLLASGRSLMGDVLITWPVVGFPHYQALVEKLEADPMVEAAAPALETLGLLKLPDESTFAVQVVGIEGESFDRVTGYREALWWKPLEEPLRRDAQWQDERLWNPPPGVTRDEPRLRSPEVRELWRDRLRQSFEQGAALTASGALSETGEDAPAVVLGVELGRLNTRETGGWYTPNYRRVGNFSVNISVLPVSARGAVVDTRIRRFPVVNNVKTGLFDADSRWALVRLDALQEMLGMDEGVRTGQPGGADAPGAPGFGVRIDERGNETFVEPTVAGRDPARVTSVLVRAAPGVAAKDVRRRSEEIYGAFAAEHTDAPDPARMRILTWDERPGVADFINAVRKEIGLVLFLFGFISLTAVFLVFAILWSMVSEKTKDVGVLRAVGASRLGIAWLFVRYGVAIGIVGAAAGGALAFVVVRNINEIHEWLGSATGLVVWTPGTYQFGEIPGTIEPVNAACVLLAGVLASAIGALAPALKAARLDPVEALRFE